MHRNSAADADPAAPPPRPSPPAPRSTPDPAARRSQMAAVYGSFGRLGELLSRWPARPAPITEETCPPNPIPPDAIPKP